MEAEEAEHYLERRSSRGMEEVPCLCVDEREVVQEGGRILRHRSVRVVKPEEFDPDADEMVVILGEVRRLLLLCYSKHPGKLDLGVHHP